MAASSGGGRNFLAVSLDPICDAKIDGTSVSNQFCEQKGQTVVPKMEHSGDHCGSNITTSRYTFRMTSLPGSQVLPTCCSGFVFSVPSPVECPLQVKSLPWILVIMAMHYLRTPTARDPWQERGMPFSSAYRLPP